MGGERERERGKGATVVDDDREGAGINIETLQEHFHQPLVTVAEELGVSLTMIKRLCRKLGMPRWPYRQIYSINKNMEDLRDQLESAQTEADRERYRTLLEAAMKKKRLITRGAAAGVDPNVRNALYLADTANVSEEDIFDNPELMPKLSAALKTITKRKRVKGKPLVDLIATVKRDGSLPACVQSAKTAAGARSQPNMTNAANRSPAMRRHQRPPALVDAMATSHEEYTAKLAQAYGSAQRPASSTSATTSVSPALSHLGNGCNSARGVISDEHAHLGWGHNRYASWSGHGTPASTRSLPGSIMDNGRRRQNEACGRDIGLHETLLDSPASSCTTIIAGTSPGAGDRFSPGGSLVGGFSPASKKSLSPGVDHSSRHSHLSRPRSAQEMNGGDAAAIHANFQTTSGQSVRSGSWLQAPPSPSIRRCRPQKRLSTTSSVASTDVESLDTSNLLDFDDDDDDDGVPVGEQPYLTGGHGGRDVFPYPPSGTPRGAAATGGRGSRAILGGGAAANAPRGGSHETEPCGVSPEDLQELEDTLLMDSFGVDELLDEDDIGEFPDISNSSFPDLHNVAANLPPSSRTSAAHSQRSATRVLGAAGSPRLHGSYASGNASPSAAGPTPGVSLTGSSSGAPRPGPRTMGRPPHQVPPRPYTPNKSSRGTSVPWLSHGLGGGVSPRVNSSRPPTPTSGATTPSGRTASVPPQRGTQQAPSPNSRRRGPEAFSADHFALPSPNENGIGGRGAPSPKARRVGARAIPERFPGSPQASSFPLSPQVGYTQQSPRMNSKGPGGPSLVTPPGVPNTVSSLDSSRATSGQVYFPAPAAPTVPPAPATGSFTTPSANTSVGVQQVRSRHWASAPLHGGSSVGGVDACSSASAPANTGLAMPRKNQSWNVRPGESKSSTPQEPLQSRQSWSGGVAPSSNSLPSVSPRSTAVTSSTGDIGEFSSQGPSTWEEHAELGERAIQPGWSAQGHGVLQRRHSAPLPPVPMSQPASASEWVGELDQQADAGSKQDLMNQVDDYKWTGNGNLNLANWNSLRPATQPLASQEQMGATMGVSQSNVDTSENEAWWAPLGKVGSGDTSSGQGLDGQIVMDTDASAQSETGVTVTGHL